MAKRVSDIHAAAVIRQIKALNCPASRKSEILDTVIKTAKEQNRDQA